MGGGGGFRLPASRYSAVRCRDSGRGLPGFVPPQQRCPPPYASLPPSRAPPHPQPQAPSPKPPALTSSAPRRLPAPHRLPMGLGGGGATEPGPPPGRSGGAGTARHGPGNGTARGCGSPRPRPSQGVRGLKSLALMGP